MRIVTLVYFLLFTQTLWAFTRIAIVDDFSKWSVVTSEFHDLQRGIDINKQEWKEFQIHTQHGLFIITKGYSLSEFKNLISKEQKSARLWDHFIAKAYAAETECGSTAQISLLQNSMKKITLDSIVKSCEWNPATLVQQTVEKIIAEAKGILSLDVLQKITSSIQAVQKFINEFKMQVLPGLMKLTQVAPDIVNNWACEKMRAEIPLVVMSAAFPAVGLRRFPLVVAESLNEVQFLVSDKMINYAKMLAKTGRMDALHFRVFSRLTNKPPEVLSRLSTRTKNLEDHAELHKMEFSKDGDINKYYKNLDEYTRVHKSGEMFYESNGRIFKFNAEDGKILITSSSGEFITFFRVEGNSIEERLFKFLNKASNFDLKKEKL